MRISDSYSRFRGSVWFVLFVCVAIAGAAGAHLLFGFDADWGITNLGLSMEASISVALLIMASDRNEEIQRAQLRYLLHLIEVNHALLVGDDTARTDDAPRQSVGARDSEN